MGGLAEHYFRQPREKLGHLSPFFDDAEAFRRWENGMRSPYDIEVKLRSTTAPNMRRNASRLIQEFKSGKAATTDLFLGSENHLISLKLGTVNRTENTFEGKLRKRTFLGDHMILEFMIKDISMSVKGYAGRRGDGRSCLGPPVEGKTRRFPGGDQEGESRP
jgi:hypothetical protein